MGDRRSAIVRGLGDCKQCTNECYLIINMLFDPGAMFPVWQAEAPIGRSRLAPSGREDSNWPESFDN